MAANTPVIIAKKSQEAVIAFLSQCFYQYQQQWNIQTIMEKVDREYAREVDYTIAQKNAQLANKLGDTNRFQNITIPVVLPQVESAVTYQSSVFLTGVPLFGVAASPDFEDEAAMMETTIDQQAIRGGWVRELTLFFRDGFKYNNSAVEVSWTREVTAAIETDLSFSATTGKPKEVIWEGNTVKRLDMYNTFYDTRVTPSQMYKDGEFAGYTELFSRIKLKQYIAQLPDQRVDNIKEAFESAYVGINVGGTTGGIKSFYIPQINPDVNLVSPALASGQMDWMAWAGLAGVNNNIDYKNMYQVTTLYARILPSDFGIRVPSPNTPQVWKFVIVNFQVIIYAERQTNAHGYIPILFGQPLEDGLQYQTKSLAQNVSPIQSIVSALSNSNIAARRRAISDRTLYDPSRITEAHINNPNPSAKIPVRPAAYGKNIGDAVHQFPFRDDQSDIVTQQMTAYTAYANIISGQNPVRQGQFVKGNKTQSEFQDVMAHANGRDQLTSIGYETSVFTPLKEILKINILQYQGGVSLFSRDKGQTVTVDPVALRKSVLNFKVSDGLTPTDKLMDSDTMMVAMQQIGSSQQLAEAYNLGPMFSYLMKIKNVNLTPFEKSPAQQSYEQAQEQWQQTIMQVMKANPNIQQSQLPPQPKPADYGYNPNAGNDVSTGGSPAATGDQSQAQPGVQVPASANPGNGQAQTPTVTTTQNSQQNVQQQLQQQNLTRNPPQKPTRR